MENANETVLLTWIGSYLPRGGGTVQGTTTSENGGEFSLHYIKRDPFLLYEIINKGQLQNVPN